MFLMANKNYILDCDTWKFIGLDKPLSGVVCDVPVPFWSCSEWGTSEHAVVDGNTYDCVKVFELNGFSVAVLESGVDIRLIGGDSFHISWTFDCSGADSHSGISWNDLYSVYYIFKHNGESKGYHSLFGDRMNGRIFIDGINAEDMFGNENFKHISGFVYSDWPSFDGVNTEFGLSEKKFQLYHKGISLRYSCYAFVIGAVAILLTDDMKFDGIAYLFGATGGILFVDKIAYSTKSYLIKQMTLANG